MYENSTSTKLAELLRSAMTIGIIYIISKMIHKHLSTLVMTMGIMYIISKIINNHLSSLSTYLVNMKKTYFNLTSCSIFEPAPEWESEDQSGYGFPPDYLYYVLESLSNSAAEWEFEDQSGYGFPPDYVLESESKSELADKFMSSNINNNNISSFQDNINNNNLSSLPDEILQLIICLYPDFIKSRSYKGSIKNYVFKLSWKGLGYYYDDFYLDIKSCNNCHMVCKNWYMIYKNNIITSLIT